MDHSELQQIVDAIVGNKRWGDLRPHQALEFIHRKKFPMEALPILEPLLQSKDMVTYKCAIDMVGNMKGAAAEASEAVEAAWKRSWSFDVPQACIEAFRALLKIGGNDDRLLRMINKAMQVDNYGIHKVCAETLMKISGGDQVLAQWNSSLAGKCDCHLHQKLAKKIDQHLDAS